MASQLATFRVSFKDAVLTVANEVLDDSHQESYPSGGGFTAVRKLKCAWADRHTLAQELRGGITSGVPLTILTLPHRYPVAGTPPAFVTNVVIAPMDGSTGISDQIIEYGNAELTVTYSSPDGSSVPNFGDDPDNEEVLITERMDTSAEFFVLPNKGLFWDAGALERISEDVAPGIVVMLVEWVYTIHTVPFIPSRFTKPDPDVANDVPLVGAVNDRKMVSRRMTIDGEPQEFEAETLLMSGPSIEHQVTSNGVEAWKITVRMTWKPDGWNKFRKQGNTAPQAIFNAAGAVEKVYKLTNFTDIIQSSLSPAVPD